ncbi:hypothetical protein GO003_000175 [Methylicorpusculum oleiharenae]|uniref:UDP-galactopyranose mutase n=1 Tax=Methylicorpusculum oleiharenae TaxID=1338687 RepID=UPI00135CE2F8|nr:UDP-galactopyranose mutase [Methylicorpusculum oleiharenae]MCD2448819.1 hypothetical protein [Methylicorpusculum oleiharenae]
MKNEEDVKVFLDSINCEHKTPANKFVHERLKQHDQPVPTINFTDEGIYSRQTDWRLYPGCDLGGRSEVLLTKEIPCRYEENNYERYYPIKKVDGIHQSLYQQYRNEAKKLNPITFIGPCGQYIYYDYCWAKDRADGRISLNKARVRKMLANGLHRSNGSKDELAFHLTTSFCCIKVKLANNCGNLGEK